MQQFKQISFSICLLLLAIFADAQEDSANGRLIKTVILDSVYVEGMSGLEADTFIARIRNDTTFFQAFRNLRFHGYSSKNKIFFYDNHRQDIKASFVSKVRQYYQNNCRWMTTLDKEITGNYFNWFGNHKYYTAELYEHLFLTEDTVCNDKQRLAEQQRSGNKKNRHSSKLKTLIFEPGRDIKGVPLIGKKLSIFHPDMTSYYNYEIKRVFYLDSIPCYVFKVRRREGVQKEDVIINHLTTYFHQKNFQVMARSYNLSYSTVLYDFDVKMRIRLRELQDGETIPFKIQYMGYWDIPFNKPEVATFEASFWNFQ